MVDCGWNEYNVVKNRIQMYKRFHQQNPQVVGILPILTLISIVQVVYAIISITYYLFKIIAYCDQIDDIIFAAYRIKQSGHGNEIVFEEDLEQYIQQRLDD